MVWKYISRLVAVTLTCSPICVFAGLQSLNDDALSHKSGQAGITVGLDMVINKVGNTNTGQKDCAENSGKCQFGLQFDNQNDPNLWLTLTGVTGGLKMPKTTVESVDVTRNGNTQSGLKVTFNNAGTNKAVFTDFGYDSLRLSQSTVSEEGYRTTVGFGTGVDAGRQPGFLGMRINGPVTMTGSMTMFDCGACE